MKDSMLEKFLIGLSVVAVVFVAFYATGLLVVENVVPEVQPHTFGVMLFAGFVTWIVMVVVGGLCMMVGTVINDFRRN